MAVQPESLIGAKVSQVQPKRVFPAHDGVRPGTLGPITGAPDLPDLTPLSFNETTSKWAVWDDATAAIDDIDGFLYSPAEAQSSHATNDTVIQVFRAGSIHRDDIPVPTTAAQTQGALDTALKDQELRKKNIEVLGLALVF